jgi:hypothetical protein
VPRVFLTEKRKNNGYRLRVCAGVAAIWVLWMAGGCEGTGRREQGETAAHRNARESKADSGTIELRYDDGSVDSRNSPWGDEPGGQVGVRFSPPLYPVAIERVGFFICYGSPYETEFRVRVYRGDRDGGPERDGLLAEPVTAAATAGDEWLWVDVSQAMLKIDSGDFFVCMEWLTPPGDDGSEAQMIGADETNPVDRSWWRHKSNRTWVPAGRVGSIDRNLMIRAVVRPLENDD